MFTDRQVRALAALRALLAVSGCQRAATRGPQREPHSARVESMFEALEWEGKSVPDWLREAVKELGPPYPDEEVPLFNELVAADKVGFWEELVGEHEDSRFAWNGRPRPWAVKANTKTRYVPLIAQLSLSPGVAMPIERRLEPWLSWIRHPKLRRP